MPTPVRGMDCKTFYKVDGDGGAGSYVELSNVGTVTISMSADDVEVLVRSNNGFKSYEPMLKEFEASFELVYDTSDTDYNAFETAYNGGGLMGMKFLDGGTEATGSGPTADMKVTGFEISEPIDNVRRVSITLKAGLGGATPGFQAGS